MSELEVWATGRLAAGYRAEDIAANVEKLFPGAAPAQLDRFLAGYRFVVTRLSNPDKAAEVVEALARAGVEAEVLPVDELGPLEGVTLTGAGPSGQEVIREDVEDAGRVEPHPSVSMQRVSPYLRSMLLPGERLLYVATLSIWWHVMAALAGIAFIIVCLISAQFEKNIFMGVLGMVGGSLCIVLTVIDLISTEVVLTDQRVLAKTGLAPYTWAAIPLGMTARLRPWQGMLGRKLDYARLDVFGRKYARNSLGFRIVKPAEFHDKLQEARAALHARSTVVAGSFAVQFFNP